MAYVPPYPTFQVLTHSVVMAEGDPDANGTPQSIAVSINLAHLHTAGSDIRYWVTGDDALAYWPSLPSGTFHVSANGLYEFDLNYQADTAAHLDATFTINFYPANDITMVASGPCVVTILDDDSPFNGDDAANTITASAGDDVVNARGGDDTVSAGAGRDQISGGDGNDTLHGGGGRDYIRGDAGNNVLDGGGGKDTLLGSFGNDTIYGGGGDDQIDAGAGANVVSGGAGADTFTFGMWTGNGSIEITDFEHDVDHIQISLSAWHLFGAPGFQNTSHPTGDGPELYYSAADHTLYYTPNAPGDDGSPWTAYTVAVFDNVASLSKSDFIFGT